MARPESKTSARTLVAREREAAAVKLREGGASFEEIGKQLGVTTSGAYRAVARALARVVAKSSEDAGQLRTLELRRLDKLLSVLWPRAVKGNTAAVDRVLRVMERRAKLCGLDVASKAQIEVSGADGTPVRVQAVPEYTKAQLKKWEQILLRSEAERSAAPAKGEDSPA